MANVVKHYYEDEWVDITDYVDGISEVPTILRNRDYTLKSERLRLSIAASIRDVRGVNYEFEEGEKFAVYVDGDLKFQGVIESSEYIYRDMIFDIELRPVITNLESILVEYDSLHTAFSGGANWYEYTASDYYGRSVVGLLWIMKSMFTESGLTLDVSAIENIEILSRIEDEVETDIAYQDLFMVEEVIYNLGQSVAAHHTLIDSEYLDYNKNKLNCWEFISQLVSYLNLVLVQTDVDTFDLIEKTDNYTVTDDNKFEYAKRKLGAESLSDNISVSMSYSATLTPYFNTDPNLITSIDTLTRGKGSNNVSALSNVIIMFSNAKDLDDKYEDAYWNDLFQVEPNENFVNGDTSNATGNLVSNMVHEKIKSLIEEEIETNYQSTFKSVEQHDIDLEWSNSKIKQVTYNE